MELTEQTARTLIRELRINNNLLRNSQNAKWVRVSVIKDLTGWNKTQLHRARLSGQVEFKKDGSGFWYNPDSINPIHLKRVMA